MIWRTATCLFPDRWQGYFCRWTWPAGSPGRASWPLPPSSAHGEIQRHRQWLASSDCLH